MTEASIARLPRTFFVHFFDENEKQYNRFAVFGTCWIFLFACLQNFGLAVALAFPLLGGIFLAGHIEKPLRSLFSANSARYERFVLARTEYGKQLAAYNERLRRQKEEFWRALSGVEFEAELSELFRKAGYEVLRTPHTNDGGVDILLGKGDVLTVVQCKAHSARVPISVVRELYASMMDFKANHAIIASLEGLTKPAADYIRERSISSLTLRDILELQAKHG